MDLTGIDVSNLQGAFNWRPQHGKIGFGFAKAAEGLTFNDGYFPANWRAMAALGVIRGAYCYAHPAGSALADAAHFVGVVRGAGLQHGDLLALDLETDDGLSPGQVAAYARAFCGCVHDLTGIAPILYTYLGFAEAGNCAGLGSYPLWIADPSSPAGQPRVPAPWTHWTFHQHASDPIDRDVFNGDATALAAFAGGGGDMPLTSDDLTKVQAAALVAARQALREPIDRAGVTEAGAAQGEVQDHVTLAGLAADVAAIKAKLGA